LEDIRGGQVVTAKMPDEAAFEKVEDLEYLEDWKSQVDRCGTIEELSNLYRENEAAVKTDRNIRQLFTDRKNKIEE
jgi:hypothetical protein